MKIDTKEINKISESLEQIDGWEVEDFKVWQTQSGKDMATIRLKRSDKKVEDSAYDPGPIGPVGMTTDINISD